MKKTVLTLMSIFIVLTAGACEVQSTNDYPHFDSAEAMMARADLVITAVVDSHDVRDGDEYRYDVYTVTVDDVYKGEGHSSQELAVRYMFDAIDELTLGSKHLFYLETYDNASPMPLNITQATYNADSNTLANIADTDDGFEDVLQFETGDILTDTQAEREYPPLAD